jgi:hypothetical protein
VQFGAKTLLVTKTAVGALLVFNKYEMLRADVERALEEEFLGGGGVPTMGEDYFSSTTSRTRTTGLDEVERFLQSGESAAAAALSTQVDLKSGAKRAISKLRTGAYASPVVRSVPSSSSSSSLSSSSSGATDEKPFHERMAEARRQYQKLTRERNAPKQQSWGGSGGNRSSGAGVKRPVRSDLARSYTFTAVGRPSAASQVNDDQTREKLMANEEAKVEAVTQTEQTETEEVTSMNGKRRRMERGSDDDGGQKDEGGIAVDAGEADTKQTGQAETTTAVAEEAEVSSQQDGDGLQDVMAEEGKELRVRKIVKGARHTKALGPREKYSLLRIEYVQPRPCGMFPVCVCVCVRAR